MQINLAEIARGRRIVATVARELSKTRPSVRPQRTRGPLARLLRRLLG